MDCKEFRKTIDVFLDGRLDASSFLSLQEHAEACAGCREVLDQQERLRLRVREELSSETAPARLRFQVMKSIRREDRRSSLAHFGGWRAAAAVLLALGIAAGAYARLERRDLSRLVESSVKSHRIYAVVGEPAEYRAKDERTALAWLQKRVSFPLALPPLSEKDTEMLGGRVWPLENRQTALTFYRKGSERLSLFTLDRTQVRLPWWGGEEISGQKVYLKGSGGYRVAVWKSGECVFALVGGLPEEELVRFLSLVFRSKNVLPPV